VINPTVILTDVEFDTDRLGRRRGYQTLFTERDKMLRLHQLLRAFLADDTGGEVIEYAIVLGLISIAAITVIGAFGVKVLARWNSINSSM
jgi:Flp pilus assembly pilin Flp